MGKLKANSIYRGSGICELGVLVRAETVKVGLKNIICKNMIFSTKKHIQYICILISRPRGILQATLSSIHPNFEVTRVTKTIMRVQVNNENYTKGTAGQGVVPLFFQNML